MRYTEKTTSRETRFFRAADVFVVALIVVGIFSLTHFFHISNAPFASEMEVSTSLWRLPQYAALSLIRSLFAFCLSLGFALLYASIAARTRQTERIMIPILDLLQSLPLLVFLAPAVLTLISIFRDSRWGLEFACIFMIFTGQVWNLVFAFFSSKKAVSRELSDAASLMQMTGFQRFLFLDLPNGVRPLVYNGMLSMAGGWFFLTTCEAFTLGEKNFLLPGLGSFLSVSFQQQNYISFAAGIVCMIVMILGVDLILWRPLIAWSNIFKESSEERDEESTFLEFYRKTRITDVFNRLINMMSIVFKRRRVPLVSKNYEALLKAGAEIQEFLHIGGKTQKRSAVVKYIQGIQWMPIIVSVCLTFFLVFVLPRLPAIGNAMSVLAGDDWLQLTRALWVSNLKVVCAIALASLWTVPIGLWIGLNRNIARYALPIVQNIAAFPAPIFFPLIVMVIYHHGVPPTLIATLLMALGTQWYILFNVISGATMVPDELKTVARVYRMSLRERWTKLYFPVLLPSLTNGWMTAVGAAWNITIVAELVRFPGGTMRTEGIGAEITNATESGNYPRLIASIIVFTVAVVIINRSVWRPLQLYIDRNKG